MIWRSVVNFPAYEVSDEGLVRTKLGKTRIAAVKNQGFQRVRLIRDGRAYDRRVNVVVLLAFVGPRPSLRYRCEFLDGDRTNMNAKNLCWALRVPKPIR